MEEKIKEILDMSCEHFVAMPSKCKRRAAKEIKAHVFEFIEWKDFGEHPFVPWYDEIDGKIENYYTDEINKKHWSINDLYEHWLKNVKK